MNSLLKCRYCGWVGGKSDFEWDHMDPKIKTESFLLDFLQGKLELICSGCNRQKSDKTSQDYTFWRWLFPRQANFGPIRAHTFMDTLLQRIHREIR
ncbi:HNH endonuclease [Candidatus Daviesbacteria bacterium]|nr:HNH endonuclease [Candidatus Daviesbacteria bacterium]